MSTAPYLCPKWIVLETSPLSFEAEELDESSMREIRKEVGESEESRARCLQILRKDLQSLDNIHPCLEEDFLLQVLRTSKFDPTKAMQKMLKLYQHRDKLAESFKTCSMSLEKAGSLNHVWISPYRLKIIQRWLLHWVEKWITACTPLKNVCT
ncbi:clavesin-1 [Caerostris extrusa]|uniref:Clavesin-1 n=1 Tax=Caerostris extrusa TaxID=172846 RepID=A0AAV4QN90_CAEEX|nr:clavesin-1 [Caerostris extrusa]